MRVPKYRRHTTRDLGFVEWKGRRIYFEGAWNSTVSRDAYLKFLHDNCGDTKPQEEARRSLTVAELTVRFLVYAKSYYGDGPRGTYANLRFALTPFTKRDGHYQVADYGPLRLKDYRQSLIDAKQARTYINDQVRRIKAAFRWGVSEQLVPVSVLTALETVPELSAGRSKARETKKRQPVPWEHVAAILDEVSPTIRAMLEFQWHTGARSDSICNATPEQFSADGDLLLWKPKHKTQFRGKVLVLPIGPKAQATIRPFLAVAPSPEHPIFSPRVQRPNRRYKERYNATSYRQAVQRAIFRVNRAIRKANECRPEKERQPLYPKWSPHQLRHSKGHSVRSQFGVEAAQAVLGHDTLNATELYSASRLELAKMVARQSG